MNRQRILRTYSVVQSELNTSFCGGKPKLPMHVALPHCKICGNAMTFFFQVKFPDSHPWASDSCAVFSCMDCVDRNYFIPPMVSGQLRRASIPSGFLDSYQQNFAVYVFSDDDAVVRNDYTKDTIQFERWEIIASIGSSAEESFVGGKPIWLEEDETPEVYGETTKLCFLLQIAGRFEFPTAADSPGQLTLGRSGKPMRSQDNFYNLFIGNQIYFFGTLNQTSDKKVYIITQ